MTLARPKIVAVRRHPDRGGGTEEDVSVALAALETENARAEDAVGRWSWASAERRMDRAIIKTE